MLLRFCFRVAGFLSENVVFDFIFKLVLLCYLVLNSYYRCECCFFVVLVFMPFDAISE